MQTANIPDLTRCLRTALASEPDDWGEDRLHASDLRHAIDGEGCARQLKLRLTGAEKRQSHDGERWMHHHGHRLQREAFDLIRPQLERLYPGWHLILWEQDVTPFLPPGIEAGRVDSALVDFRECVALPVDCKTRRGKSFDYMTEEATPANAIQVRGYVVAFDEMLNGADRGRWHVPGGVLLVLDREGQNFARWHYVPRDDQQVYLAAERLRRIKSMPGLPAVLSPVVKRRVNKGPDSLTLASPWNCDYCPYRDVSCPGALPPELRDLGIVGKDVDGSLAPVKGVPEEAVALVRSLMPPPPEDDGALEAALVASLEVVAGA